VCVCVCVCLNNYITVFIVVVATTSLLSLSGFDGGGIGVILMTPSIIQATVTVVNATFKNNTSTRTLLIEIFHFA
jgi:hypothetical protein